MQPLPTTAASTCGGASGLSLLMGGPAIPTVQAASNPDRAKAALVIVPRSVVIVTGSLMQMATHLVTLGMQPQNGLIFICYPVETRQFCRRSWDLTPHQEKGGPQIRPA